MIEDQLSSEDANNKKQNKALRHNPLPAPSRISGHYYNPQPESMSRSQWLMCRLRRSAIIQETHMRMSKAATFLLIFILSSCAGANYRRTLSIEASTFEYELRLSSRYHDVWFDVHDERSPESKLMARAWVTNLSGDAIKTNYVKYDGKEPTGNLYQPIMRKPLVVAHNESRMFFEGPIHLLGMSFTEAPVSGTKIRIKILLSKVPQKPLRGSFASTWGGP